MTRGEERTVVSDEVRPEKQPLGEVVDPLPAGLLVRVDDVAQDADGNDWWRVMIAFGARGQVCEYTTVATDS